MISKEHVFCWVIPVVFPEGLHYGAESRSNALAIALAGDGTPLLRGSAVAGVLRSELARNFPQEASDFFGEALNGTECRESRIVFHDLFFEKKLGESSHNRISRHRGAVLDGCVFSLERILPGAETTLFFEIFTSENECEKGREWGEKIIQVLQSGLTFGGCANRGIGRLQIDDKKMPRVGDFALRTLDGVGGYQKFRYAYALNQDVGALKNFSLPAAQESPDFAAWEIEFAIPRGQDLLIGGSPTTDPVCLDNHWVIPGSALRGALRNWIARLMALDGIELEDGAKQYDRMNERPAEDLEKPLPDKKLSALAGLFGSLSRRGRIHISDAVSTECCRDCDLQLRTHVSIDRFSGGFNDGGLFKNHVLIASPDLRFRGQISLRSPSAEDIAYLTRALHALHNGLIRIGSSKASGRLEIVAVKRTAGTFEISNDDVRRSL